MENKVNENDLESRLAQVQEIIIQTLTKQEALGKKVLEMSNKLNALQDIVNP